MKMIQCRHPVTWFGSNRIKFCRFSNQYSWCFYRRILETRRTFSSKQNCPVAKNPIKYTNTLNLPKSQFLMKHCRSLEQQIATSHSFDKLYNLHLRDDSVKTKQYVLHDGPPYANGEAHFGHSINKILKDIFVKRNSLQESTRVHYVPGWDCHGLPIELKALQNEDVSGSGRGLSPLEIRRKARALAYKAIENQKSSFSEWNISADWSKPYTTFDIDYITNQLQTFYRMYRDGLIFRSHMPVYWSPSTGTALAEAELQYNHQHLSKAAYVRYLIADIDPLLSKCFLSKPNEISALIWTTTPWTLLANEAIAYSDKLDYRLVSIGNGSDSGRVFCLIASELIQELSDKFPSGTDIRIESEQISSQLLTELRYRDPITGECRPFLASQHVTTSKGTGLVHIAPNHGYDDYKLVQRYPELFNNSNNSNPKSCIVNKNGELWLDNGNRCLSIIDDNQASNYVLEQFGSSILLSEDYRHSYPYDWRSGKPVIVRPSSQWFLNIDLIRDDCLKALNQVRIYPERLRKELVYQINSRPNWCISRQRNWGVPIPVFYRNDLDTNDEPILTDEMFYSILDKFRQNGSCDIWWEYSTKQLLDGGNFDENLVKGGDIFDIWFDSGCSWQSVLPGEQVADLYLEGVDQIRGWFQSSLITSVACRGRAPYRTLFIHGFALDKDGKKMSKSIGNVIDPMDIVRGNVTTKIKDSINQENGDEEVKSKKKKLKKKSSAGDCGVDGLRFWIAQHACTHNDVHVDLVQFESDILSLLNRIRNTFRFILGYLAKDQEFLHSSGTLLKVDHYRSMNLLDKHLLHRLALYNQSANLHYQDHNLGDLIELTIHHFLYEVSTFYLSRIKDRLYCEPAQSLGSRSILTCLWYLYHTVAYQLAPILPHIILEVDQQLRLKKDAIFDLETIDSRNMNIDSFVNDILFPEQISITNSTEFTERMSILGSVVEVINRKQLKLQELDLHLVPDDTRLLATLKMFQNSPTSIDSDLCELFQVASLTYYDHSQVLPDWIQFENQHIPIESLDESPELISPIDSLDTETGSKTSLSQKEIPESKFRFGLIQSRLHCCVRCRRFTASESGQLCSRCNKICPE